MMIFICICVLALACSEYKGADDKDQNRKDKDQNRKDKMIIEIEEIGKKKPIGKRLMRKIRKAFCGERYPLREIENLYVNAEKTKTPSAITQASVNAVLSPVRNPYESSEEPSRYSEEKLKFATIRRTYSVRHTYQFKTAYY
jgi:hypothetical protein